MLSTSKYRWLTLFLSLFLISSYAWTCSSIELLYEEKNISYLENRLEKNQYDSNYLFNQKEKNNARKSLLNKCLVQKKSKIELLKNILSHQSQTSILPSIKVDFFKVTLNSLQQEKIKNELILAKAINLDVEIDQKLVLAQTFQFKDNNRKNIFELFETHQNLNQSLSSINVKPFDEIFSFFYMFYKEHQYLIWFIFAFSLFLSISLTKIVKMSLLKYDLSKVYLNIRLFLPWYIFLILPFVFFRYETIHWLNQPPIIILMRWFLNVMTIQILASFYINWQVQNSVYQNKLYSRMNKIINGLLIYSFIQFAGLNFFQESYLIDLIYLLVFNNLFYVYFMYHGIRFIYLTTDPKFHDKEKTGRLIFSRYMGILVISIYLSSLLGFIYMGYQRFSTAQVLYVLMISMYLFKFIQLEKSLFKGDLPWANHMISSFKSQFGSKLNQNIWEINIILFIFNIYLILLIAFFCMQILSIPDSIILWSKGIVFDFKKIGFIDVSINSVFGALTIFSLATLIGKYVAHQISLKNDLQKDPDKLYRVKLLIEYLFWSIAIVITLLFLGVNPLHLSFIIGTLGFGLSVGLQTTIKEFFAGIIILSKKIISLGDYVKIILNRGVVTGRVYLISTFSTQIYTDEQVLLTLPNTSILDNSVINYTKSESIQSCYIYLPIQNLKNYNEIVEKVYQTLSTFNDIHQKAPRAPDVKILNSTRDESKEFCSIFISFYVDDLALKKEVYIKVKKALLKKLGKNIVYDDATGQST